MGAARLRGHRGTRPAHRGARVLLPRPALEGLPTGTVRGPGPGRPRCGMTRLILWRHGRTEWNLIGRFQGHLDVDLDDVGIAQAEEASHRVALYEPDVIVSSDPRRATRTAG